MTARTARLDANAPLPTLPAVVARVLALFAAEDYRTEDVVRVLEHDAPISSRVLRLANSAYYGFPGRVDRLQRAVVLLGAATVQGLALATAVLDLWDGDPPEPVREIWVHAYLTAEGSRLLRRRIPDALCPVHPDTLFLAGLFHDLGKIWFLASDPEGYPGLLDPGRGDLRAHEAAAYGWDHAEAGGRLLETWGLPASIVALVRFHHEGELRAELRAGLDILRCAHAAVLGGEPVLPEGLPPSLAADLRAHIEAMRPEAEAFYQALT